MNPRLPLAASLLVTTSLALAIAAAPSRAGEPPAIGTAVGQTHPDLVLPRASGEGYLRLSDYRGKKVFLFHFASW